MMGLCCRLTAGTWTVLYRLVRYSLRCRAGRLADLVAVRTARVRRVPPLTLASHATGCAQSSERQSLRHTIMTLLAHRRRLHVPELVMRGGVGSVRLRVRHGVRRALADESDGLFMVQCSSETQRSVRSVFHSRCAGTGEAGVCSSAMGGTGSHQPVSP